MTDLGPTARLLRRDQWIVGACLILIAALAWAYLAWTGIQMARPHAMDRMDMGGMDMGDMAGMEMPGMVAPPQDGASLTSYVAGAFVMWALMMVAMMLPSAAPMILLYARVARGLKAQGKVLIPTALFAAVYLGLWTLFSIAAAALQGGLVAAGLVEEASLRIGNERIAGGLLIAAGIYQLTPLKAVCIRSCRSPLSFLTTHWRPDAAGAVRLGLAHGLYCLGCCWLLMALLFVGGVMNLVWVAVLALIVMIEKVAPFGRQIGVAAGALAVLAGGWLLLSPLIG